MQFSQFKMYKVVETDDAIAIIDEQNDLNDPKAQPLMKGYFQQVSMYLDRYMWEREHGTERRSAHERALNFAGITVLTPTAKSKLNG